MPPIYPLLFALYPVLALLSVNVQEIPLEQSLRSLAAALGGCVLLYAGLAAAIKQTHKAAAIASTMVTPGMIGVSGKWP